MFKKNYQRFKKFCMIVLKHGYKSFETFFINVFEKNSKYFQLFESVLDFFLMFYIFHKCFALFTNV